jgi:hypothetical protein
MPQCQFPIFCCFCVSEMLHRKYSRNWTKPKPDVQIFHGASRTLKRRRNRARGRPHHREAWPGAGPRPLVVWAPWSTSDAAPSPIKTPRREKPKHPITSIETHRDPPLTRVNSTNVLNEGLRIGGIGRRMNSKVKLVEIGVCRK